MTFVRGGSFGGHRVNWTKVALPPALTPREVASMHARSRKRGSLLGGVMQALSRVGSRLFQARLAN